MEKFIESVWILNGIESFKYNRNLFLEECQNEVMLYFALKLEVVVKSMNCCESEVEQKCFGMCTYPDEGRHILIHEKCAAFLLTFSPNPELNSKHKSFLELYGHISLSCPHKISKNIHVLCTNYWSDWPLATGIVINQGGWFSSNPSSALTLLKKMLFSEIIEVLLMIAVCRPH